MIFLISFTDRGQSLAETLARALDGRAVRCGRGQSLDGWTREHFQTGNALIFVGAAGIAVRAIAPHVKSKTTDPAVVVVDEGGRFAVPILRGNRAERGTVPPLAGDGRAPGGRLPASDAQNRRAGGGLQAGDAPGGPGANVCSPAYPPGFLLQGVQHRPETKGPGLLAFCRAHGLELETFSAAELQGAPGEFSLSEFVERVTGVDNVCERAAVLGSGGTLCLGKRTGNGVAMAVAMAPFAPNWRWQDE